MKILYFFLYSYVIFALLDPDPATQVYTDPCGSGSTALFSAGLSWKLELFFITCPSFQSGLLFRWAVFFAEPSLSWSAFSWAFFRLTTSSSDLHAGLTYCLNWQARRREFRWGNFLREAARRILTINVPLFKKLRDIIFFLRDNNFLSHFEGHFEGAKTFLSRPPQNVQRNGSKSYCPQKKYYVPKFLKQWDIGNFMSFCNHGPSIMSRSLFNLTI